MALATDELILGELAYHVACFERDGYTHLTGVFTSEQVTEYQRMRELAARDWRYTKGTTELPDAVDDLVERFPRSGLEAVAHPILLAFAEAVMGPVVQLDSAVLAADPPVEPNHRLEPVVWHRDRFGFFPLGVYTRPHSIVLISYLQEMTDEVGPLRVIPGSHREPVAINLDARTTPHPAEVLVRTVPGDVVVVHHNVLHSGTRNVSDGERRFLGFIYNMSSLIQRDNFDGPNCQALIATARRTNNRRILRLLGQDPLVVPRQNSGFVQPHTTYWPTWHEEDERYATEAEVESAEVDQARAVMA